ncbi:MAG: hypothetical protein ACI89L_001757 [Phycisphaerales bacterium]|jgi:hypothetical protein
MNATHESELHRRLAEAVGKTTYRRLGQLTDTHPETVRRYMQGQSPGTEFLANLCRNLAINANWLLTGRGPMKLGDIRKQALSEAHAGDLLTAMANSISSIVDRLDRLELFVQGLDTRLRGAGRISPTDPAPPTPDAAPKAHAIHDRSHPAPPTAPPAGPASGPAATNGHAADRVGRAVAKRSSPDAR